MKVKLFSAFLLLIVCFVSVSTNILAANTVDSNEYIVFSDSTTDSRINSDGTFTYRVRALLESDRFTVDALPFVFSITPYITNTSDDIFTNDDEIMRVTFYKDNTLIDTEVLYLDIPCDGQTHSELFRVGDFEIGETYYFSITSMNPNWDIYANFLYGNGRITNITVVE